MKNKIDGVQKIFDDISSNYDSEELRFFKKCAEYMVTEMEFAGTEAVLDVATGTGHLALEIAKKLTTGRVVGIDISPQMLKVAEEKKNNLGLENLSFIEMNMEELTFNKEFDIAVCAFGIFFTEDMQNLLKTISSVVRSGGTIAMSTFGDNVFSPLAGLFFRQLVEFGGKAQPTGSNKKVCSIEQCRGLFESVRISNVSVINKNIGYFLKNSEEWWRLIKGTAFSGFLSSLEPQNIELFKEKHLATVDELSIKNGIWVSTDVLFTIGTI